MIIPSPPQWNDHSLTLRNGDSRGNGHFATFLRTKRGNGHSDLHYSEPNATLMFFMRSQIYFWAPISNFQFIFS